MNTTLRAVALLLCASLISSCRHHTGNKKAATSSPMTNFVSQAIPVDTANRMIRSYVNGNISADSTPTLNSVFVDAKLLRKYLDSIPLASQITHIKIMFAHTLSYINNGDSNTNAKYRPNALTLILAGVDAEGNYIVLPGNQVMNRVFPCPPDCPTGTAGGVYIQ